MLKAAKYTLAAALMMSGATFAFAQGEPTKGSDPNAPAAVKQQSGETKSAPATGPGAPAASGAKQVQTPTAPATQGAQTGTAADPAGPGQTRAATPGPAGMKTQPTGMPTNPGNAGSETGTASDPAGPGAERKGGATK